MWRRVQRVGASSVAVAVLGLSSGCSLFASTPAPPAVGDSCLVGGWVDVKEDNSSGYTWLGLPLAVSGLAGAQLKIQSDGTETQVFDGSQPLVGLTRAGQQLAISIRGSVRYRIHGDGKNYTESGTGAQMPTTATLNGQPVSYHSAQTPGPGTYSCTKNSLTMTTRGGVQTDSWARSSSGA